MLLILPPGTPTIYYHGINFWVEVVSIATFFIGAIILSVKRKNQEDISKKIKTGYAAFMVFYALARILFIIAVWFPSESWSQNSFDFFSTIGDLFITIGLTSIIFVIEKYLILQTHRLATILGIVMSCLFALTVFVIFVSGYPTVLSQPWLDIFTFLSAYLGHSLALALTYASAAVLVGIILVMYIYLAIKGTATLRRNAILIIVAVLLILAGDLIDSDSIVAMVAPLITNLIYLDLYYCLAPAILIIGVIIFVKVTY
jgi:membrane-associated HD superfamily phosphohydrolase